MAFKLRSELSKLNGASPELMTDPQTPVFLKKLDKGVAAEANRDGTIYVDPSLSPAQMKKAVDHEMVHIDQMKRGDLNYDNNNVYWKGKVIPRSSIEEGNKNLPWEAEAYKKSNT
jgi:hypothetical protein